jgi:uncharacterized protein YkwD
VNKSPASAPSAHKALASATAATLMIALLSACNGAGGTPAAQVVGAQTTNAGPLAPTSPAPATPTTPTTPAVTLSLSADQQQLLDATNAARAQARQCGDTWFAAAPAVRWNASLAAAAQGYNADMIAHNFFNYDHSGSDGSTPATRISRAGYTGWTAVGENIAAGYTMADVVDGWIKSVHHCEALMNPRYTEVGIDYAFQAGTKFGTYFTQDFGTRQ